MPHETIAWYQILIAAVLTGAVVWLAARRSNWAFGSTLAAAFGAAVLIGLWRWLSNALDLNDDFMPLVSVGDAFCLIVGGIAPSTIRRRGSRSRRESLAARCGRRSRRFLINVAVL